MYSRSHDWIPPPPSHPPQWGVVGSPSQYASSSQYALNPLGLDLPLFSPPPPSFIKKPPILRIGGNPVAICCVHNKQRGLQNLEQIAPGMEGLRCMRGSECKGAEGQSLPLPESGDCTVHGKRRALQWLERQESGGMKCKEGYGCMSKANALVVVGGSDSKDGDDEGRAKLAALAQCAEHHKNRTMEALQDSGGGSLTCKPGARCKGSKATPMAPYARMQAISTGTTRMCATHGKARGSRYLTPHVMVAGAFMCKAETPCK